MNNQVFVTNIVIIGTLHCRIITRRQPDKYWIVQDVDTGILYHVSPTTMFYAELFA